MTLAQWWEIIGWIVFAVMFAFPGWMLGYRQGYQVGRTDGESIARKYREQ